MSSLKFAKVVDGVVDVISFYPDREKVIDYEDRGGVQVEVGWHWGDVLPPWEPVPDNVFGGFTINGDGSFSAPEPLPISAEEQIKGVPSSLFGGPTLGELFNDN